MSAQSETVRRLSVVDIAKLYADGVRIATITAYDFPTAALVDEAGIPLILVGDSLAQVMLGYDTTVRVSMDEMLHHTKAVVRGSKRALIVGDMPFLSYATADDAVANAGRFLREGGAQAVKVEGGVRSARTIEALVRAGIPVMGHIGLTPQAINAIGRVRVQGKNKEQARAAARGRPRGPGGRRLRDRAGAGPGAARGGDHRAPPDPDDRDRGGGRVQRPDPGDHGHARLGRLDPEARPQVRGPAGHDRRGDPGRTGRTWRAATFPGPAETVLMDPAVLDEVLGRTDQDRAGAAGIEDLAGIPLDRDL